MDDEEPMSVDSPSPSGVPFGVRFRSPSDTDSQSSMTKEVSDAVFEQKKDESVWFCNNEFANYWYLDVLNLCKKQISIYLMFWLFVV